MSKYKLVPAEPTLVAWVTADTVDGQSANGKPRRIWWESNEGVGMPIYATPQPEPEVAKLAEALEGLLKITDESLGVSGYHLNGNMAKWCEFEEVEMAEEALAIYRQHGGDL